MINEQYWKVFGSRRLWLTLKWGTSPTFSWTRDHKNLGHDYRCPGWDLNGHLQIQVRSFTASSNSVTDFNQSPTQISIKTQHKTQKLEHIYERYWVSTAIRLWTGRLRSRCSIPEQIFPFTVLFRAARKHTQIPTQWILEVKREVVIQAPPSAEIKKDGAIPTHFHTSSWHGA